MTPFNTNLTLDPLPSITEAPSASKRVSILDHSSAFGAGSVKMASSVFRCLLFMW